jgi:hypothetical protein
VVVRSDIYIMLRGVQLLSIISSSSIFSQVKDI